MKTAMTELRDKLLEVVKNCEDINYKDDYILGYLEAFENIINDIDEQMLEKERKQLENIGVK